MKKLIARHKKERHKIKKRLGKFEGIHKKPDKKIFEELCFCILTPQSKAVYCDKAIKDLKKANLLLRGSERDVKKKLKGLARFHNKKALYLVEARKAFRNKKRFDIKKRLNTKNIFKAREWLVENIKGLGYKEASHFLRNIGLGENISILDVHILKNLKRLGVIKEIPNSVTKKNYKEIEKKMRRFSKKVNIPLEELDLLFWSNQTGFIFK